MRAKNSAWSPRKKKQKGTMLIFLQCNKMYFIMHTCTIFRSERTSHGLFPRRICPPPFHPAPKPFLLWHILDTVCLLHFDVFEYNGSIGVAFADTLLERQVMGLDMYQGTCRESQAKPSHIILNGKECYADSFCCLVCLKICLVCVYYMY